ncbi:hypothetical protein J6590_012409 [Homalodisca vitripennis]|nr:hypothetical protein J6590_012409 [Homalodisca vitripennis]
MGISNADNISSRRISAGICAEEAGSVAPRLTMAIVPAAQHEFCSETHTKSGQYLLSEDICRDLCCRSGISGSTPHDGHCSGGAAVNDSPSIKLIDYVWGCHDPVLLSSTGRR